MSREKEISNVTQAMGEALAKESSEIRCYFSGHGDDPNSSFIMFIMKSGANKYLHFDSNIARILATDDKNEECKVRFNLCEATIPDIKEVLEYCSCKQGEKPCKSCPGMRK